MTLPAPGTAPGLTSVHLPVAMEAVALVLHGGAERGEKPVDSSSLPWRRGRALARAIARGLPGEDVGVLLLRYRVKGWNARSGGLPDPVLDARWALEEIQRQHDVPVAIVGHSMGARTGVAVADHPSVRGVVALAPWLPVDDPVEPLTGKVLRAAHGRRDRITSARATRTYVDRATAVADATFSDMGPLGHYLLRGLGRWHSEAVAGVHAVLH